MKKMMRRQDPQEKSVYAKYISWGIRHVRYSRQAGKHQERSFGGVASIPL
jgi:hypothetical protein